MGQPGGRRRRSNGNNNGIVWSLTPDGNPNRNFMMGRLRAWDALSGKLLCDAEAPANRMRDAGGHASCSCPTVALVDTDGGAGRALGGAAQRSAQPD